MIGREGIRPPTGHLKIEGVNMSTEETPGAALAETDANHHPTDLSSRQNMSRRNFVQGTTALVAGVSLGALMAEGGPSAYAAEVTPAKMGPRKVRVIENLWIPMADSVKIAARLWLPEDAEQNPVPAIMEYIPYRKRDMTRSWDETQHPYLASYGYACIRPDIRGSGDSEGQPQDEYVKQEQDDGVEIIAWLAKQPWCTGKVGMFGISWGGFSALQVAARHPRALKAIITHCSTDDRYSDDAHYLGGCVVQDMFVWGSMWTAFGGLPPDPAIVGNRWQEMWKQRLDKLEFHVGNWLTHQHRDAFWKHASVAENYSDVRCAVYAVGGWVDAYDCAIPRLLANLKGPRKGLIGPWGHYYPNKGVPGPAIDWLTEALRWWDYWLKSIDTGIMKEPIYRVWMQNEQATLGMRQVSGHWVAEDAWPSSRIAKCKYYLTATGLDPVAGPEVIRVLQPLQTVGITAPHWCPFDMDTQLPTDQRIDDARSLTFDSEPLQAGFDILGAPIVTLELSVDKPVAFLAVRLNEVQPTGASTRVTYAVLNLTQRDSREFPTPLEPKKRYRIRIQLRDRAHTFKPGNRLRVAVSTTYWPLIWPSPEAVTLTLYAGQSALELPVRPRRPEDAQLKPFGEAFVPENTGFTDVGRDGAQIKGSKGPSFAAGSKELNWDVATQRLTIKSGSPLRTVRSNVTETELAAAYSESLEILDNDPTSAKLEHQRIVSLKRGDWDVRSTSTLRMSLTHNEFLLTGEIKVYQGDVEAFSKQWDRKIPRDLV